MVRYVGEYQAQQIKRTVTYVKIFFFFFYVLLTMHLSIFTLVINQLDAQNYVLQ